MTDREIDRQLVARAQRGDKQAFELLVEKYQRKLARLLSRFIRDPAEVEDVTQEAFIKAYRALPAFRGDSAFYTWLYRIGINTAKNYLMAMGRRAPTSTEVEAEEAEGFEEGEQLRDINTPESLLLSNEIAETVNATIEKLPEELRTRDSDARDRGDELRGHRASDGLPDRHGAIEDLPGARGDRGAAEAAAGHTRKTRGGRGMKDRISAVDGRRAGRQVRRRQRSRRCAQRRRGAATAWRTYHLIGDAMRDSRAALGRLRRAPRRAPRGRADGARAARAPQTESRTLVRAVRRRQLRRGGAGRAGSRSRRSRRSPAPAPVAQVAARAPSRDIVPLPSAANDYLLAHQGFSPRVSLQGMAPYVRTVSEQAVEPRK